MKKILTLTLLLWAAASSVVAQSRSYSGGQSRGVTVTGKLMEGDTQGPAMEATVQLLALPDSAYVTGVASDGQGNFRLSRVKAGKYLLKVSYIGFKTLYHPLQLNTSKPTHNVGTLTLESDAIMLAEAVIVAEAPQVQVVEDTLQYNSSAYRTPEGSTLEELVKKLPGAEVDEDGNIKINGKDISKIMVNGKEFFGGDVATAMQNLPVEMIEKLKTYDKKSDLARITGIDDGEEETVLDLTVKKEMETGWFGNADVAGGTKDRYSARAMINHFRGPTLDNTSSLLDMDVKKIEQLLKFGAYAFADTVDTENQINTLDFKEFMKRNSRTYVIKDTPNGEESTQIEGPPEDEGARKLRFNQAYFVPRNNKEIDFKDPQFWDKVLGPRMGERLFRNLEVSIGRRNDG